MAADAPTDSAGPSQAAIPNSQLKPPMSAEQFEALTPEQFRAFANQPVEDLKGRVGGQPQKIRAVSDLWDPTVWAAMDSDTRAGLLEIPPSQLARQLRLLGYPETPGAKPRGVHPSLATPSSRGSAGWRGSLPFSAVSAHGSASPPKGSPWGTEQIDASGAPTLHPRRASQVRNLASWVKGLAAAAGALTVSAVVIGILGILVALVVRGGVALSSFLYPWLLALNALTLAFTLLVLAPNGVYSSTPRFAGNGMVVASYVFGATLWVWSLLLTYTLWGTFGLILGLLFAGIGVVPLAMLATLLHAMWSQLGQLAAMLVLTLGVRAWGLFLLTKADRRAGHPRT